MCAFFFEKRAFVVAVVVVSNGFLAWRPDIIIGKNKTLESHSIAVVMKNSNPLTIMTSGLADLPFAEHVQLIQLMRSVQQPSADLCRDQPAGQALYLMAECVDRAAEHLHDVARRRSKFNASGLPLANGKRYLSHSVSQLWNNYDHCRSTVFLRNDYNRWFCLRLIQIGFHSCFCLVLPRQLIKPWRLLSFNHG